MRESWKVRRKQLYTGMSLPMPRLLTMALMLAIMALIFVRLRDPNTWRFFAQDNGDDIQVVADSEKTSVKKPLNTPPAAPASSAKKAPATEKEQQALTPNPSPTSGRGEVPASPPGQPAPAAGPAAPPAGENPPSKDSSAAAAELTPTGPTDLDRFEQENMQNALLAVRDGTQEMSNRDMPAYFQILSWVDHQSTALLRKRAKRDVLYSDFRKTPDSMRLQIVELKLNVRQIIRLTKPPEDGITEPMTTREGSPLYEIRGFTQEGGTNLYIGIVTDLPAGMPIGTSINEDARLVGYFFKLQGYISQQQQLEAERTRKKPVTLKAPIIMGRLIWLASPGGAAEEQKTPFWLLVTIGSVAIAVVVGWVLLAKRKPHPRTLSEIVPNISSDSEGPTVDNWLDQAQSGRLTLEALPETTARFDGAARGDGFGDRLSGNIFGENGESNNGHDSIRK